MSNQTKNPIFWCLVAILAGLALGTWGIIKTDCIGPDCWIGSGFLKWTGGILLACGFAGWLILGNGKRKQ